MIFEIVPGALRGAMTSNRGRASRSEGTGALGPRARDAQETRETRDERRDAAGARRETRERARVTLTRWDGGAAFEWIISYMVRCVSARLDGAARRGRNSLQN